MSFKIYTKGKETCLTSNFTFFYVKLSYIIQASKETVRALKRKDNRPTFSGLKLFLFNLQRSGETHAAGKDSLNRSCRCSWQRRTVRKRDTRSLNEPGKDGQSHPVANALSSHLAQLRFRPMSPALFLRWGLCCSAPPFPPGGLAGIILAVPIKLFIWLFGETEGKCSHT